MITEKFGAAKIVRYSAIEEMPIVRFMTFNRFVLIDSGIGSNLEDIDKHDSMLIQYAHKKDFERVTREVENRNQAVRMIMDKLNPKYMSYAALVYSINGVEHADLSEEGLRATVNRLGDLGATHGEFEKALEDTAKK